MFIYDNALVEIFVFGVLLYNTSTNMIKTAVTCAISLFMHYKLYPPGTHPSAFFTTWMIITVMFTMGWKNWGLFGLGFLAGSGELKKWLDRRIL